MTPVVTPDYANKGITLLKDARIVAISLVDRAANNHEFFLFKRASNYVNAEGHIVEEAPDAGSISKFSPLLKMAQPHGGWKTAYCVVAVPGEIDQQRDVWDEEGIIVAAHDFMKGNPIINHMHQDLSKIGDLVESAIAPVDVEVDGFVIKKGSWYVGIQPHDSIKSQIDEGKIRGVSVQGTSKRENVAEADMEKYVDTNVVHKNFAIPGSAPVGEPEAAGAMAALGTPQEVKPALYRSGETIHIPLGASGPGVKILQRIVGISQTGIYDQTTEAEFINFLSEHGLDPEPTLEILQSILRQLAASASAQAAEASVDAAMEAPVEGVEDPAQDASDQTPEAPVSPEGAPEMAAPAEGVEQMGKDANGPFNPAGPQAQQGPGTPMGVDPKQISGDSSSNDMKLVLQQAVQTGNQSLAQHLSDVHGVNSPDEIVHHEFEPSALHFMVNMFVLGKMPGHPGAGPSAASPSMNQPGATPRELLPTGSGIPMHKSSNLSKGSMSRDGSHGGHDPKKHGRVKYLVHSFGEWAGGKQSVAAKVLLAHGVAKTPESADRLAAWLKDQWMGTTMWRGKDDAAGSAMIAARQAETLGKRFESMLPDLRAQNLGLTASAVEMLLSKMAEDGLDVSEEEAETQEVGCKLCGTYDDVHEDALDAFHWATEKNGDDYQEVSSHLSDPEALDAFILKRFSDSAPGVNDQLDDISKSSGAMTSQEYTQRFDSAIQAVALGLVEALKADDPDARLDDVSHVLTDFDGWAREFAANSVPEVDNYQEEAPMSMTKAASLVGQTVTTADGQRCVVVAQDGDSLTVSVGNTTKKVAVGDVSTGEPVEVAKSSTLDTARLARLVQTVNVLNEHIQATSPEATEDDSDIESEEQVEASEAAVAPEEAPVSLTHGSPEDATELEKEDTPTEENTMSDTDGSNLNDVIHFCNDLAESMEDVVGRLGEFDGLGSKIEKVGELAKNLDVSERIAQLEEQVKTLSEALAPAQEAVEATEAVAKRLEVIENQPGERTSVLADGHTEVKKSVQAPLFTRGGHSLF